MNANRYKVRSDGTITPETAQEREIRVQNRKHAQNTRERLEAAGRVPVRPVRVPRIIARDQDTREIVYSDLTEDEKREVKLLTDS